MGIVVYELEVQQNNKHAVWDNIMSLIMIVNDFVFPYFRYKQWYHNDLGSTLQIYPSWRARLCCHMYSDRIISMNYFLQNPDEGVQHRFSGIRSGTAFILKISKVEPEDLGIYQYIQFAHFPVVLNANPSTCGSLAATCTVFLRTKSREFLCQKKKKKKSKVY